MVIKKLKGLLFVLFVFLYVGTPVFGLAGDKKLSDSEQLWLLNKTYSIVRDSIMGACKVVFELNDATIEKAAEVSIKRIFSEDDLNEAGEQWIAERALYLQKKQEIFYSLKDFIIKKVQGYFPNLSLNDQGFDTARDFWVQGSAEEAMVFSLKFCFEILYTMEHKVYELVKDACSTAEKNGQTYLYSLFKEELRSCGLSADCQSIERTIKILFPNTKIAGSLTVIDICDNRCDQIIPELLK